MIYQKCSEEGLHLESVLKVIESLEAESLNTAECGEQLYSEGIHDKTDLQDVVSN